MKKPPSNPAATSAHLDAEGTALYEKLRTEYAITDSGGVALLSLACKSEMLIRQCQTQIDSDGLVTDKGRAHPLLNTMRDAKNNFLSCLRALNLDVEPALPAGGQAGNFNSNAAMKKGRT